MFCSNCGNKLNDNAEFCGECGNQATPKTQSIKKKATESQSENSEIRSVTSKTSPPKTVILVGLLLLGGLLGTGIGYLWLNPQINELQETVQIRDNKINSLEEQQRQDKNSIASMEDKMENLNIKISENELIVLDLENKIIEKDIKLDDLENEISQKEVELNEINQELSDTKEQINILDLEIDDLKINEELNKEEINNLEELRDSLQSRVSQLNSDRVDLQQTISELREEYQELKELWDLWADNRDIAPSNNVGYRYQGYKYDNGIFIPFPNARSCLDWVSFVGTGSMRPFIFKDTLAIGIKASCLAPSDIKQGDIISFDGTRLFERSYINIGHQVIDVVNCSHDRTRTCYVTKGTNNDSIDGEIRFEEVINKIVIINF